MRNPGRVVRGLFLLTTVFCFVPGVFGDEVRWETNPEAALQRASATGQPVLMKFTADWCGHCKRMERTTFADPEMVEAVHQNFIPVLIDTTKHGELAKQLKITGLPALLIVAPDLTIVDRIRGYQSKDELLPRLSTVLATHRFSARVPAVPAAQQRTTTVQDPQNTFAAEPAPPVTQQPNPFDAGPNPFETETASRSAEPNSFEVNPFEQQSARQQPAVPAAMPSFQQEDSFGNTGVPAAPQPPSFNGLCLTSVIEQRQLVQGSQQFAAAYRGQTLHFRNAAQRDRFFQSPEKYWPVLEGMCAITLLETGEQVAGELKYAAVFRDQIWVFRNRQLMQQFISSPADYVQQVEQRQKLTKTEGRSY